MRLVSQGVAALEFPAFMVVKKDGDYIRLLLVSRFKMGFSQAKERVEILLIYGEYKCTQGICTQGEMAWTFSHFCLK